MQAENIMRQFSEGQDAGTGRGRALRRLFVIALALSSTACGLTVQSTDPANLEKEAAPELGGFPTTVFRCRERTSSPVTSSK